MTDDDLDIGSMVTWEDGLPCPQWEVLNAWVESRDDLDDDARRDDWSEVVRQWLRELAPALGAGYIVEETENFALLAWRTTGMAAGLLRLAEKCRAALLSGLGYVADFGVPGKQVLVAPRDTDDYYRYVSLYHPEGEFGGSSGMHIREGYPHVVMWGKNVTMLENTLAHELTHASLHHREMPQWVEEGLAQMFEHNMTGRAVVRVDWEMAEKHKDYWGEQGLDAFWYGDGFHLPGEVQKLSYQLAEILVRLLVEDAKPRWFGLVRKPRERFLAFLCSAKEADCGAQAFRKHLGYGLDELAGKFLGAGQWSLGY